MTFYSESVMTALRGLEVVVDLNEYADDVTKMHRNNMKRSAGRSSELVMEHTQRGYGAEVALIKTGLFTPAAAMVENADEEVSYADRMRDLYCEGLATSVKTMKHDYRFFYVTDAQFRSIRHTEKYCDIMVVVRSRLERPGVYWYKPAFVVDNKRAHEYIRYPAVATPWNSRIFHSGHAEQDGACVVFKEDK